MASLIIGRSEFGNPQNTGNTLSETEALALLHEWVPNVKLQLHMKQVAALMMQWALQKEGLTEAAAHQWWLAGLLHDADWEKYPDKHPQMIIAELETRNIDPIVIRAIASHGPKHFGVQPVSAMDKMIYAFDELSGFIHAAALIRPAQYEGMDVKSVMKKFKTPSFAAQVSREEVADALAGINLSIEEMISWIIPVQKNVV